MSYELQSLERALAVVDFLTAEHRCNLTELAAALEANPSTLLRTLRVLERHGLVRREGEREYRPGYRLVEWGDGAARSIDARREIHGDLERLAEELHCTVHLSILRDQYVTVIDKITYGNSVVHYSLIGSRIPLHCSAMGKAVLGLLGPDSLDRLGVGAPLASYTEASITSVSALRDDIAATQRRGFSIDREEFHPGFVCAGIAFSDLQETYAVSATAAREGEEDVLARGRALGEWLRGLQSKGFPLTATLTARSEESRA